MYNRSLAQWNITLNNKCIEPGCSENRSKLFRRCEPCRNSIRRYGLSTVDRNILLENQGGVCKLCPAPIAFNGVTRKGSAVVDHCHVTGNVRGILCIRCNVVVSQIDAGADLQKIAIYLNKVMVL